MVQRGSDIDGVRPPPTKGFRVQGLGFRVTYRGPDLNIITISCGHYEWAGPT